jgi:thiamine-monophosphate kinase
MPVPNSAGAEFAVIDRWRRRLPGPPAGETWIGDDAAVLLLGDGPVLLTTDMSIAGVHADLTLMGLDDLGWRAVAAAVSDIAAMGGRAAHVLAAVAGPPSTDLDTLLGGISAAVAAHRCALVGGDLSNAADVVVVVSVTGLVDDTPGPVRRRGARSGDELFVTGPLGAAAAGLRSLRAGTAPDTAETGPSVVEAFLRPRARLAQGQAARRAGASAMIDISDGLAADLGHLARASGVGFDLDQIPVAAGATIEEALGGGEDYELVFAAPDGDRVRRHFADGGLAPPTAIGRCTADQNRRQWDGEPLPTVGWQHGWS